MPLMRPRQGRWLTGVCKGIALHLGIGVAWVRIAFIALTVLYGAGIIAYVFLWVFMPAGDPVAAAARTVPVNQAPLARGNQPLAAHDDESAAAPESLSEAIQRAPKPAVVALAGFALMATGLLLTSTGADVQIVFPLLVGLGGIALAWMNLSPRGTQLLSMLGGIALIFMGWALYVHNVSIPGWGTSPRRIVASGFVMIVGIVVAVMPWANAMLQRLTHEQALKEREEERADMTAHLHDGVLQTLALIQLHSEEPTTVFALARSQERELREWLYQERSTSNRSVGAGLKQIAAEVEDEHGKPIEVVTVGDARPSAQTDALLDATRQALVNAVTHGGEPVSLYCEASDTMVEVFVRDHGEGFDMDAIPPDRLGHRGQNAYADRAESGAGRTSMSENETAKIRVAVVDDHEMFRAGVIATLRDSFDIVGQAADVPGSVAMIAQTKPQVVLLDVHVPGGEGGGGAEILAKSRPYSPTTVFLALSVSDAPQDVGSVIRAGAQGYVTKTITGADLISSIKQVHEGYAVFSPKLAGFVLSAFQGVPAAGSDGGADGAARAHDEELDRLSAREQEVMRLIARGYTYKEVAAELFISIKTVETHVSSVLRKLQLSNRTELTRWAADRRIV